MSCMVRFAIRFGLQRYLNFCHGMFSSDFIEENLSISFFPDTLYVYVYFVNFFHANTAFRKFGSYKLNHTYVSLRFEN